MNGAAENFTLDEAAAYLRLRPGELFKWAKAGAVEHFKKPGLKMSPRNVTFKRAGLDRFTERFTMKERVL